eukprot:12919541-Prorocentrum_lima.AAC.1
MHYTTRNTPGEPESLSKDKWKETSTKSNTYIEQEQGDEPSRSSVLGALMWIAFRTRPVTRVSRAAKSG